MPLLVVLDPTPHPAAFGRAAAERGLRSGARFMHLPARFDLTTQADAAQYVYAAGGLGPSGLSVVERMLGEPVAGVATVERIVTAAQVAEIVVPIHSSFGQSHEPLVAAAADAGVAVMVEDAESVEWASSPTAAGSMCRIALIGREADHREVYPAALDSLQRAAAALGRGLEIVFVDPKRLDESAVRAAHGILLPGGSDMGNVPGQIRAAHCGLAEKRPVLGLCLGMQTMTTALAQRLLGDAAVNLAEADPAAPIKSFIAMADTDASVLPTHRTGDAAVELEPNSLLATVMAARMMSIRCNHRYHLAPELKQTLAEGGLTISATSFAGRVADAIELAGHPFFVGLQGHPELTPGYAAGHPVFSAFLRAASG